MLITVSDDSKAVRLIYQMTGFENVKLAAFLQLMRVERQEAKTSLIEPALKSDNDSLRHAALAAALQDEGLQAAIIRNVDQMTAGDRLMVLANIQSIKPASAAEKIALGGVGSAELDVRVNAILALGRIGTKPAFDAVLKELGAHEPPVNQAAATALAGMSYPEAEAILLAMLKGGSAADKVLALKAMVFREVPDGNTILMSIIKGKDEAASKEAMRTYYFTASLDDLRSLCAEAASTSDPKLKASLVSLCIQDRNPNQHA